MPKNGRRDLVGEEGGGGGGILKKVIGKGVQFSYVIVLGGGGGIKI